MIGRGAQQWLAVLAPEGEEGIAQAHGIESPMGIDSGRGDRGKEGAGRRGQAAENDGGIDRIRDHESRLRVQPHQPEILHQLDRIGGHIGGHRPRKQRLQHRPNQGILKPIR